MSIERELVEKWRTHVFRSASDDVGRLLDAFPKRRNLSIAFGQCGTDYRFTEPLLRDPDRTLEAGRRALGEFVVERFDVRDDPFGDGRLYLRIRDLPDGVREPIDSIGAEQLNRLLVVEGTVESTEDPRPRIVTAAFRCSHCEEYTTRVQRGDTLQRVGRCRSCSSAGPLSLAPRRCEYVDAQEIRVADGGRALPVSLEHDLAGAVDVGDDVRVAAIPRAHTNGEGTAADLRLEAVNVERRA